MRTGSIRCRGNCPDNGECLDFMGRDICACSSSNSYECKEAISALCGRSKDIVHRSRDDRGVVLCVG